MKTKTAVTGRRFDTLEQEAFLGLWRTYDRLRELEDELFARYDLTAQQYNAMRLLRSGQDQFPLLLELKDHGDSLHPLDSVVEIFGRLEKLSS